MQGSGIWQDGSFVDWYAGAELTRKYDFNAPVTEDITLYAKWRYPFSVCAYDRTNSADYDGGQYMVLGENLPERMRSGGCNLNAVEGNITFTAYPAVGYVFAGWYKGEYAGMVDDSHTMVSRPLDMEDSANLLSADREFTYPLNGYAVICAVFEKCTSHNWEQHIEKATPDENGYIYSTCSFCREETAHAPLLKVDHIALSALSGTSFTYTGKAIRPGVTVANGEGALPADVYTVTYLNNVNAGTATARVTLRGDYYTGTKDLTFTIGKAPNTLTVKGRTVKLKASKVKKKNQTVKVSKAFGISSAQGSVKFKKISGSKKIKVAANGRFTVRKGLKKGTYKIKVQVTAAGGANYAPGTKTVTVKIRIK